MSYAIIGFGAIGQALARAFTRKNIEVVVAGRRPVEDLAPKALEIGPTVVVKTLQEALQADTVLLAVRFQQHREVAEALPDWSGKTIVDAMNSLAPAQELDGLLSSAFVAKAFPGAKLVKGSNHLPAAALAADPVGADGHRVVFLSSDDEQASASVAGLAKQLGFAPVELGKLQQGGALVHAQDGQWGKLIFQDLSKRNPS